MMSLKQAKEMNFSGDMEELVKAAKELKSKREEYASLVNNSTEGEVSAIVTSEKYKMEYLWVKLGNYATKNGVTLKLNVLNGTTGLDGMYNLEFIINGKYAGITEFVYEVENDSTLGFKIDNFSLTPTAFAQSNNNTNTNNTNNTNTTSNNTAKNPKVDTEILTATFTVKDVAIEISKEQVTSNQPAQEDNTVGQEGNTVVDNTIKQ